MVLTDQRPLSVSRGSKFGDVPWILVAAALASILGGFIVLQTVNTLIMISCFALLALAIGCVRNFYLAWAVYFAALCSNGVALELGSFTLRPEYIATPILIASMAVNLPTSRRAGKLVLAGLGGWLAIAAISSLWMAPDPTSSVRMLLQLTVAVMPIVIFGFVDINPLPLVRIGTWILATISTVSIAVWLASRDFRIAGLAFEPNIMGSLCVGWLCVMAYYAFGQKMTDRKFVLAALPILIALLLTVTRAAWVALGILVLGILIYRASRHPISLLTSIVAAMFAVVYTLSSSQSSSDEESWQWRVTHVFDLVSGTGGYRVQIWRLAIDDIGVRNLGSAIGSGLNSFSQYHPIDPTRVASAYLSNLWIGLIYDAGLLGLVFFVMLVVGLFVRVQIRALAFPLFISLAICASFTNIVWFAFPWVFIMLLTMGRPWAVTEKSSHLKSISETESNDQIYQASTNFGSDTVRSGK